MCQTFYYQEALRCRNFRGRFGVVVVFYCKSHTYNYAVNGQQALISLKLETNPDNHFGTERVVYKNHVLMLGGYEKYRFLCNC